MVLDGWKKILAFLLGSVLTVLLPSLLPAGAPVAEIIATLKWIVATYLVGQAAVDVSKNLAAKK